MSNEINYNCNPEIIDPEELGSITFDKDSARLSCYILSEIAEEMQFETEFDDKSLDYYVQSAGTFAYLNHNLDFFRAVNRETRQVIDTTPIVFELFTNRDTTGSSIPTVARINDFVIEKEMGYAFEAISIDIGCSYSDILSAGFEVRRIIKAQSACGYEVYGVKNNVHLPLADLAI